MVGDLLDIPLASEFGADADAFFLSNTALLCLASGVLAEVVSAIQADLSAGPRPFLPIVTGSAIFVATLIAWIVLNEATADATRIKAKESSTEFSMSVVNLGLARFRRRLN